MTLRAVVSAYALIAISAPVVVAAPLAPLEEELSELASHSKATVGIFVEHIERHQETGVNWTRPFPMASTFKLPLAIVVLAAIEHKELPSAR